MSTITSNMPESSPTNPIRTPIHDFMVYGPKDKPEEPKNEGSDEEDIFPRAKLYDEDGPNPYYIDIAKQDQYVSMILDADFRYAGVNSIYVPGYIKEALTRIHVGFPKLVNEHSSAPENRLRTTVACWQLFEIYLHTLSMNVLCRERNNGNTNTFGAPRRVDIDNITDSFWLLFDLLVGWVGEPHDADRDRLDKIEYEINDRYEELWRRVRDNFIIG